MMRSASTDLAFGVCCLLSVVWFLFPHWSQLLAILAYVGLTSLVLVSCAKRRQWASAVLVFVCFFGWPLLIAGGYLAFLYFTGSTDPNVSLPAF